MSSTRTRLSLSESGTSPATMRCARPSTMAVLPTPGSPISTGLFLVRRCRTWIARRISSSRPMTGSSLPSCAPARSGRACTSSAPRAGLPTRRCRPSGRRARDSIVASMRLVRQATARFSSRAHHVLAVGSREQEHLAGNELVAPPGRLLFRSPGAGPTEVAALAAPARRPAPAAAWRSRHRGAACDRRADVGAGALQERLRPVVLREHCALSTCAGSRYGLSLATARLWASASALLKRRRQFVDSHVGTRPPDRRYVRQIGTDFKTVHGELRCVGRGSRPQRARVPHHRQLRASIQRLPPGRRLLLLPEGRLRLQIVHQEFAGLEGLPADAPT